MDKGSIAKCKDGRLRARASGKDLHFSYTDKETGNLVTVSLNVIEPEIEGGDKLKAVVKSGEAFDFATTIPLNAQFGEAKNDGVISDLIYGGEESVGEDGRIHLRGKAVKSGTVTIPFKENGKKYQIRIKVV